MADSKHENLTRYKILRSSDEGKTAEVLGDADAQSSEQALRKWFSVPPRDQADDDWYAAVSVNALRWRQVAAKVTTKISEATTEASNEPAQEPESLKV